MNFSKNGKKIVAEDTGKCIYNSRKEKARKTAFSRRILGKFATF